MTSIHETLERLNEADRQKFITMRMSMRRAYLMCIQASVGMQNYIPEDDTFMDAIDIKVEMLSNRAGLSTPNNDREKPNTNGFDPFEMLTRLPDQIEAPKAQQQEQPSSVQQHLETKPALNNEWKPAG